MRIPSATGLVFASLALSGTSLAVPTPASPNPGSPNPANINSPRPDLDSPRFSNSPGLASPRAFGQAAMLNRRNNRVRRPLGRKHSIDLSSSPLMPDGSDTVVAAPMQRSHAHMSARDEGRVQAEGLGLIDQPTADTVRNALHGAADALKGVPGAGLSLAELFYSVGDTVATVLGPSPAPPQRRALPTDAIQATTLTSADQQTIDTVRNALQEATKVLSRMPGAKDTLSEVLDTVGDTVVNVVGQDPASDALRSALRIAADAIKQLPEGISFSTVAQLAVSGNVGPASASNVDLGIARRQVSADASSSTADGTLNAEGLGLFPSATGQQLDDALHSIGNTVSGKVPVVGPIVGGVLGTVGNILSGLITRDHIPDPGSAAASAYQQIPAGTAYSIASPYVGSAPGTVIEEFVGPDGVVYEEVVPATSQAMPAAGQLSGGRLQQTAGNVVGQALGVTANLAGPGAAVSGVTQVAGQTVDAAGGILPAGLLGGALESVHGLVGGAQGLVNGVVETASGVVPGVGTANQIIGYLSNGLPVFSTASASVQALAQPQQVGQTVAGAPQTLSGILAAGSTAASASLQNTPGQVVDAAQAATGNIPLESGILGSLPIVGKDGNLVSGATFGILSDPAAAASNSLSTSAAQVGSSDPSVDPTASAAPDGDGADSGDESGDDSDGSEDDDAEGKDPTDDNDDPTPSSGPTPSSSGAGSSTVSATPSATQSVSQGTPTPSLPSGTA